MDNDGLVSVATPVAARIRQVTGVVSAIRWSTWLALAVVLTCLGLVLPDLYWYQVFTLYLFYAILTLSMDLIAGRTGQLSLGQAGFVAIGAYGAAMGQSEAHLDPWVAFLIAIGVGCVAGLVISIATARLRGFYLAMVTVGFAEVVTALVTLIPGPTGGASGLSGFQPLSFPGVPSGLESTYFASLPVLLVPLAMNVEFSNRYTGIASAAVRDRVQLARAIGVNVPRLKAATFVASGGLAAAAGALYASALTYISPDIFNLNLSIFALVAAVAGGFGTTFGPVLGAAVIFGFQQATASNAQFSLLFYAALLALIPLLFVRGLGGAIIDVGRKLAFRYPKAVRLAGRAGSAEAAATKPLPTDSGRGKTPTGLRLEGLRVTFGAIRAVDDVSLQVAPKEVLGIIGANGAGKTTLLQTISGNYTPTQGRVLVGDTDFTKLPMHARARRGIVTTFQDPQLLMADTVRSNIASGCLAAPRGRLWRNLRHDRRAVEAVAAELGLLEVLDQPVTALAAGLRKVVELARSVMSQPVLLLLDEPAAGLSHSEIRLLVRAVRILQNRQVTMIVCDHRLELVAEVCERVIVMDNGAVIASGTFDEVVSRPEVAQAYLGNDVAHGGLR